MQINYIFSVFLFLSKDQDTQDSSDEEEDPPVSEEISEDKHPVDQTEQPSQSLQNSGDTGISILTNCKSSLQLICHSCMLCLC